MNCQYDDFVTDNKKSFSNHMRWHKKLMSKQSYAGINTGEKNGFWKGDKVSYVALHGWVKRHKVKPEKCEKCNEQKPYDLANISGLYKRDITDFLWLCRKCHMIIDGRRDKLIIRNKTNV